MKTFKVINMQDFEIRPTSGQKKNALFNGDNSIDITDGYHTFSELYQHREDLFIKLCKYLDWSCQFNPPKLPSRYAWRSKLHSDGTSYEGYFIMGLFKEKGKQITYHLPLSRWDETDFVETLEKAPTFDGHTSEDVIERLKKL